MNLYLGGGFDILIGQFRRHLYTLVHSQERGGFGRLMESDGSVV